MLKYSVKYIGYILFKEGSLKGRKDDIKNNGDI